MTTGETPKPSAATLASVAEKAGERGTVYLLALFTLPNIFLVPSFSFLPLIFGIPAILLAVQIFLGNQNMVIPEFLGKRKISGHILRGHEKLVTKLAGAQKSGRPNSGFAKILWTSPWRQILAAVIIVETALVCLPIPLVTIWPAIGLLVLIVGLLRESRAILAVGVLLAPILLGSMYWGAGLLLRAMETTP